MGHTPGPWEIQQSPDCGKYIQVISPSYRKECDAEHVVCELRVWRRPDPAQDARLVASAPDLLAACKLAMSVGGTQQFYVNSIIADAIANAEGVANAEK
jgi:hypothetical protein